MNENEQSSIKYRAKRKNFQEVATICVKIELFLAIIGPTGPKKEARPGPVLNSTLGRPGTARPEIPTNRPGPAWPGVRAGPGRNRPVQPSGRDVGTSLRDNSISM